MKREDLIDNVVHVSSKFSNSAAYNPLGVCFKKNSQIPDVPYITVQGTITENPTQWEKFLDIVKGPVPNKDRFKIFSNFSNTLAGSNPKKEISDHAPLTAPEIQAIEAGYTCNNNEKLDFRTKQIFLPFNNGYLVATPTESAGIVGLIQKKTVTEANKETGEKASYIKISKCKGIVVGGAKPQNVSVKATERTMMHHPLFFAAPIANLEIQKRYSYMYRDMFIKVDRSKLPAINLLLDNSYNINQKKRENVLSDNLNTLYAPFFKQIAEMRDREYDNLTPFNDLVYNNTNHAALAKKMFEKTYKLYDQMDANTETMLINIIKGLL